MDPLLRLIGANAVAATVLALAVAALAAAGVRRRHPAVVHVLWVLVLAKLVVPPAWELALLRVPEEIGPATGAGEAAASAVLVPARTDPPEPAPGRATGPAFELPGAASLPEAALPAIALGALLILGAAAYRIARFRGLVRTATSAPPAIAERASRIAAALGLRRAPRIRLADARIPPVLWPGPPCEILLPAPLLEELRADELDSLLAHELAHVRRRDHWTRALELAATALFWWHPVAWWARRNLRAAEEASCDALVVRTLGHRSRAYANALLKTIEFLGRNPSRPVPALATGAGEFPRLKERLTMIVSRSTPRPLSRTARLALAAVALGALVVGPSWTVAAKQATPPAPGEPPAIETPAPAPDALPPAPAPEPDAPAPAALPAAPALERLSKADRETAESLRQLHQESMRLEKEMVELQSRRALLEVRRQELETEMRALDVRDEIERLKKEGHDEQAAILRSQIDLKREQLAVQRAEIERDRDRRAKQIELEGKLRELDLMRQAVERAESLERAEEARAEARKAREAD